MYRSLGTEEVSWTWITKYFCAFNYSWHNHGIYKKKWNIFTFRNLKWFFREMGSRQRRPITARELMLNRLRREYKVAFDLSDTDKDGRITRREFGELLKGLNMMPTKKEFNGRNEKDRGIKHFSSGIYWGWQFQQAWSLVDIVFLATKLNRSIKPSCFTPLSTWFPRRIFENRFIFLPLFSVMFKIFDVDGDNRITFEEFFSVMMEHVRMRINMFSLYCKIFRFSATNKLL